MAFWRATWREAHPLILVRRACADRRCHARGEPVPLYGSLDDRTPFAELQHQAAGADLMGMRLRLAKLTFVGMAYNGLTSAGQAEAQVSAEELVADDDYGAGQRLMAHALANGAQALLMPSAAVGSSISLVVAHAAVSDTVRLESQNLVTLGATYLP